MSEDFPPLERLDDLAGHLSVGSDRRQPRAFTLVSAVNECASWAENAREEAWSKRANARSLVDDLVTALEGAGPSLRQLVEEDTNVLRSALGRIHDGGRHERHAQVTIVGRTSDRLLEFLIRPRCRRAVWNDLLAVAREEAGSAAQVAELVAVLAALLEHAGIDPSRALLDAKLHMQGSSAAPVDDGSPDHRAPKSTAGERLPLAVLGVTITPPSEHCVVWLRYADARLGPGHTSIGSVHLYEADWAIPNARSEGGQDFPDRTELQSLLEQARELTNVDTGGTARPYVVLARVDLGRRNPFGAIDAAGDIVDTVLAVINNRVGGTPWRRDGSAALLVGGQVTTVSWGSGTQRRLGDVEPDHYGQNVTAEALLDSADQLGDVVAGPLPASLGQALRLVLEAGQVGSREDTLNQVATIDAQSALILQVGAVEHIAAYGGMLEVELSQKILASWPMAIWRRDVAWAIELCIGDLGGMDPLFQAVCLSQSGHWSFARAYDRRADLLANCHSRLHRVDAEVLLESIGDPVAASRLLSNHRRQVDILDGRLRRTRNALAHGNPTCVATVGSVRQLSRYKVDVALELAISAHANGEQLSSVLSDREGDYTEEREEVAQGRSLYDLWASREAST